MKRIEIAESLFGPLTHMADKIYCRCPGEHNHTHPTRERDCCLYGMGGGAPTIYCAHQSCRAIITEANRTLRVQVARNETHVPIHHAPKAVIGTWEPPSRTRAIELAALEAEQAAIDAAQAIPDIMTGFAWAFADTAPIPTDPGDQYDAFLALWQPQDWLWIGQHQWSGTWCRHSWGTAAMWKMRGPSEQGVLTSFCTYRPGSYGRTNDNVFIRRFLVFECDNHQKHVQAAIINWIRSPLGLGLTLLMVCDTGKKSLHAWFDASDLSSAELSILKPILSGCPQVCQTPRYTTNRGWHPGLGGDPAMFVPSQPVRLPGPIRPGTSNHQAIIWLAPSTKTP